MEHFKQFNAEKQSVVNALDHLGTLLQELAEIGIDVDDNLKKISAAVSSIESDVLRIALLGAFSDGKTSVVAAWLGRVMEDMKIEMDESSDQLAIYKPEGLPGKCEIVDTPGLFGDKEKIIEGKEVMYEDLTKQYISEAHVVFYVVDATNPLKDSHNKIAQWVLRDLDKLAATVFVINKMDEVTDLTEPALFDQQAGIKRANLIGKLQRAANLSPAEIEALNIVCIAANPNGRGLEFWFGKPEDYESRSRLNDLKVATQGILERNVPEVLVAKAGVDVIRDVASQKIALAEAQLAELQAYEEQTREESTRIREDINQGRGEVKRLAGELFLELQLMENQTLGRLRPLSLEDLRGFLEDEIGYSAESVGYKLNLRIKTSIDHFFAQSSAVTTRINDDIGRHLNSSESFLNAMTGNALKSMGDIGKGISQLSPAAIKGAIFTARDLLGSLTGVVYKFKPWQATKIAGSISKWAGPAGVAFSLSADAFNAYKTQDLERELSQAKEEIGELIKSAFENIYDILSNDERVLAVFAPQLTEFERIVQEMDKTAETISSNREKVYRVQERLKAFELPGLPALAQSRC